MGAGSTDGRRREKVARLVQEAGLALPCQQPVRRTGVRDDGSQVEVLIRCGTRLARRCPPCAALYRGDLRAVLFEGLRDAVEAGDSVVLLTVTAPSFGKVHRVAKAGSGWRGGGKGGAQRCGCGSVHGATDPLGGTPVDPERYDYAAAVRFNYFASRLWSRTTDQIAEALGLVDQDGKRVRPAYTAVAEFQGRGAIHLHAVVRVPRGVDLEGYAKAGRPRSALLERAARSTAIYSGPRRTGQRFMWGEQVRADVVRSERGAFRAAGYLAKLVGYATKDLGADVLGDEGGDESAARRAHHARLSAAADLFACQLRRDEGGGEGVISIRARRAERWRQGDERRRDRWEAWQARVRTGTKIDRMAAREARAEGLRDRAASRQAAPEKWQARQRGGAGAESVRRMSRAWGWRGHVARRSRAWADLNMTKARARRAAFARGDDAPLSDSVQWLPGVEVVTGGEWDALRCQARRWLEPVAIT